MQLKQTILILLSFPAIFLSSCKKNAADAYSTPSFQVLDHITGEDYTNDTIFLASNYNFFGKITINPAYKLKSIKYEVLADNDVLTTVNYGAVDAPGYLIDSIIYEVPYDLYAGVRNFLYLRATTESEDGEKASAQIAFKFQPVNYAFLFHFFDFKDKDTLAVGDTAFIQPCYSPMGLNQQIAEMKVFRKIGFTKEELIETLGPNDFFWYQQGFLRQISYVVPQVASGTGITHRFDLTNSLGQKYALQHRILVQ
ncbi:MAG: hypothetical protein K1X82_14980 [Bacteroidia bacterium]|nr:hypothetical protein [Bacteroidia bacterium]